MVASGLPKVTPSGDRIEVGWFLKDGIYYSKANMFLAEVEGDQITVDDVVWSPQLFLDGKEIKGKKVVLLDIDPTNENYYQNTLEWDYGICKRRLRVIEGRIREKWVFDKDPEGEVTIKHNHTGKLRLGGFAIDDDTELVPADYFKNPEDGYPVEIGASPETFYSEAGDGRIYSEDADYATARGAVTGDNCDTAGDYLNTANNLTGTPTYRVYRSFMYFDTSGLPDTCTITAVTLGLYGYSANETDAGQSDLQLYEGTQATPLTTADFDAFNATALSDDFTNWEYALATDDYNTITLNASGRGIISKTGTTKFCLRVKGDVDGDTPTGANNQVPYASDKGVGYKPRLIVTYTEEEAVNKAYGVVV